MSDFKCRSRHSLIVLRLNELNIFSACLYFLSDKWLIGECWKNHIFPGISIKLAKTVHVIVRMNNFHEFEVFILKT